MTKENLGLGISVQVELYTYLFYFVANFNKKLLHCSFFSALAQVRKLYSDLSKVTTEQHLYIQDLC